MTAHPDTIAPVRPSYVSVDTTQAVTVSKKVCEYGTGSHRNKNMINSGAHGIYRSNTKCHDHGKHRPADSSGTGTILVSEKLPGTVENEGESK
jgi:hypothetical protein